MKITGKKYDFVVGYVNELNMERVINEVLIDDYDSVGFILSSKGNPTAVLVLFNSFLRMFKLEEGIVVGIEALQGGWGNNTDIALWRNDSKFYQFGMSFIKKDEKEIIYENLKSVKTQIIHTSMIPIILEQLTDAFEYLNNEEKRIYYPIKPKSVVRLTVTPLVYG